MTRLLSLHELLPRPWKLRTVLEPSSQPADTDMRYKLAGLNNAALMTDWTALKNLRSCPRPRAPTMTRPRPQEPEPGQLPGREPAKNLSLSPELVSSYHPSLTVADRPHADCQVRTCHSTRPGRATASAHGEARMHAGRASQTPLPLLCWWEGGVCTRA